MLIDQKNDATVERLWAEALNLGAYDVLAKPYDPTEVVRSVSLAWLQWTSRRERVPVMFSQALAC